MNTQPRIYVAGHNGLVGSAIVRVLRAQGYTDIVTRSHAELELTDQAQVREFFRSERIDQVYLAAARVGGIHANNTYRAQFLHENLAIPDNTIAGSVIRRSSRWRRRTFDSSRAASAAVSAID